MLPNKNKAEERMQKIFKEFVELYEKQKKEGTLCACGATTPEEHPRLCDYCWEGSQRAKKN